MKQVVSSLLCVFVLLLSFSTVTVAAESGGSVAVSQVNINSADPETLSRMLTGVGLSKAQAIVAWRDSNGSFDSVDQLVEVKGIGLKLLDKNRDKIVLQ